MKRIVIECVVEEMKYLLEVQLINKKIISITPYKLMTERGPFPSTISNLFVAKYIIVYEEDA